MLEILASYFTAQSPYTLGDLPCLFWSCKITVGIVWEWNQRLPPSNSCARKYLFKPLQGPFCQKRNVYSHCGPRCCGKDPHPVQSEVGWNCDHYSHYRLHHRDGGIQEHQLHSVGHGWPGQDPASMVPLLLEHTKSHLCGWQQWQCVRGLWGAHEDAGRRWTLGRLFCSCLLTNRTSPIPRMQPRSQTSWVYTLCHGHWYIQATCATSRDGLYEEPDWLSNQLWNQKWAVLSAPPLFPLLPIPVVCVPEALCTISHSVLHHAIGKEKKILAKKCLPLQSGIKMFFFTSKRMTMSLRTGVIYPIK